MDRNEPSKSRFRRWVGPLLIVSLGLNLLVIGAAAGLYVKWPRGHFAVGHQFFGAAGLGVISGSLGDRHRKSIRDELRERGQNLSQLREQADANAADLISLLRADPIDPAGLEAHFEAQRLQALRMLEDGHDLIVPRILGMTPEERHEFADGIEHRLGERKRHRRGH